MLNKSKQNIIAGTIAFISAAIYLNSLVFGIEMPGALHASIAITNVSIFLYIFTKNKKKV